MFRRILPRNIMRARYGSKFLFYRLPVSTALHRPFSTNVVGGPGAVIYDDMATTAQRLEKSKVKTKVAESTHGPKVNHKRPLKNLSNNDLYILCQSSIWNAHKENMLREIMRRDKLDEKTALQTARFLFERSQYIARMHSVPIVTGLTGWLAVGLWAIPNTFGLKTAEWFNKHYVTTEVPEPEDLETIFEVGAWTWNWMEPVMGTFTFVIVCLQMAKAFMKKCGISSYSSVMLRSRIKYMQRSYPQYNPYIVGGFVRAITLDKNFSKVDWNAETADLENEEFPVGLRAT